MVDSRLEASQAIAIDYREPENIREIGHIQPHGALLELQLPNLIISRVSANVEKLLGIAPEQLLGQRLTVLFENREIARIRSHMRSLRTAPQRLLLADIEERDWQAQLHRRSQSILLELEPSEFTSLEAENLSERVQASFVALEEAASVLEWAEIMTGEIRRLIGFERVMVYQFQADGSGVVIAESKDDTLAESLLGLHYPALDIPSEAREIFARNPLRFIPDLSYQPVSFLSAVDAVETDLDLSDTWLRGITQCHRQYLKNMGVAGSIAISLACDRGLWGLVACHHRSVHHVDALMRTVLLDFSRVATLELMRQQAKERESYQRRSTNLLRKLRFCMEQSDDSPLEILQAYGERFLDIFRADGAAILIQGSYARFGHTPDRDAVFALADWLLAKDTAEVYSSSELEKDYPPSKAWSVPCGGILSLSVFLEKPVVISHHIILFRAEQVRTIPWAGNPNKIFVANSDADFPQLSPRDSFRRWEEAVSGRSSPWRAIELEAAVDLQSVLKLAALKFSTEALRAAAKRAEVASRLKSEFLANMSHEIRTPMNAVLGFTELLEPLVTDLEAREYIDAIASSGRTLLSLINDILDLSKIEAGQLKIAREPIDVQAVVREIHAIFQQKARQKGLELRTIFKSEVNRRVLLDGVRLRQILFNLVGNALKFTEKGRVDIEVNVISSVRREGKTFINLEISVADTGIGIEPKDRTRIFDAFTQSEGQSRRKFSGTGLGLTITSRLISLMQGRIALQSEPGRGSTFTCHFPKVELVGLDAPVAVEDARNWADSETEYHFAPMKILIVDDVESNRSLLAGYLKDGGHSLLFAVDGREALHLAFSQKPDLILLDLKIPVISGYRVAANLRNSELTAKIPVIINTASLGYDGDSEPGRSLLQHRLCDGLLHKPIKRNQLLEKMRQVVPDRVISDSVPANFPPEPGPEAPDDDNKPELVALSRDRLLELHDCLQGDLQEAWESLRETLEVDALEDFILLLKDTVALYPYQPLSAYLQALSEQLKEFTWDTLPGTIEVFAYIQMAIADELAKNPNST